MVEPLHLSLACSDECNQREEKLSLPASNKYASPTNSLNRRKVRSWGSSDNEEGNREFWASIKEPYDFIMGTHLIPDNFEITSKNHLTSTEMELSWDPEDVSPYYVWSYSEFLDQYNELYEWLIQVQLGLYSHSNPPDKNSRLDQQEELCRRKYRRNLFVEQGEKVAQKYPESEEEIKWRVNYLNNKWEQLQSALSPIKGRMEEIAVELDLAHEEKLLRGWLHTMEDQIQPITCRLPRGCSLHALHERYKDNQILLKDIKAHGSILKSVVGQYERQVQSLSTEPNNFLGSSPPGLNSDGEKNLPIPSPKGANSRGKYARSACVTPRKAKSLEKRYHQVYLRSLEWHYYLEGAIVDFKEQELSCTSSDSEDEPVNKCRRLSEAPISANSGQGRSIWGWSEYEANSSETGSYIEDDYVMTSSEAFASRKNGRGNEDALNVEKNFETCEDISHISMVATAAGQSNVKMDSSNNTDLNTFTTVENKKYKEFLSQNSTVSVKRKFTKNSTGSPVTSVLTKVDRPSPNSGVFDCKHNDTDSENGNDECKSIDCKEFSRNENWKANMTKRTIYSSNGFFKTSDDVEEVDQEDLQRIIDSAILDQDWLNSNITETDSEDSIDEKSCNSASVKDEIIVCAEKTHDAPCDKESIHLLVDNAENLVKEPAKFAGHITAESQCKTLPFGITDGKRHQIKQWLNSQSNVIQSLTIIDGRNNNHIQDSCDASGELTTGESDISSSDSDRDDFDISMATEKESGAYLLSSENTPTMERLPPFGVEEKVKLRGKKRHYTTQRPWSSPDENQFLFKERKIADFSLTNAKNCLSSSETALDRIKLSLLAKSRKSQVGSHSVPKISNSSWPGPPEIFSSGLDAQLPTLPVCATNLVSTSKRCSKVSPVLPSSGSLKRRAKLRRRSNRQLFEGRTDSGSEDLLFVYSRRKSAKSFSYSPYHSPSKSLSSESETVSGCPKPTKDLSLAGDNSAQPRTVMTSSTEKCLSDSSVVSHVSNNVVVKNPNNADIEDTVKNTSTIPTIQNQASDQEISEHLGDASSLSEQAWDSYQEYKYLSEPYSEDLDVDAQRKLIEFGDDYRNFIDSDGSSFYGLPSRSRRSPRHRRMRIRYKSDSESDLEDLHHVIAESKSRLTEVEKMLENIVGQVVIRVDLENVVATASTNLKFLQDILRHLNREAPDLNSSLVELQNIVDRWGNVQTKALERQQQSAQFRQLQRQIKSIRLSIESILSRCSSLALAHTLENFSQISQKVEEIKGLLSETENLRSDLSSLNIIVHRFTSEMGPNFTPLKDEMAELYRLWDETHRRVNGELSHLQNVNVSCRLWEEQKTDLSKALKQDSDTLKVIDAAIDSGTCTESVSASVRDVAKLLNERRKLPSNGKSRIQGLMNEKFELGKIDNVKREDRLSDSGTSGYESCSSDDLSERERRLAYLRRLARDLQSSLMPGSNAWNEVHETLDQAEKELQELQDHCRTLITKTAGTLEPNSKATRFSSNCKRRNWVREGKSSRSSRIERRAKVGNRRGEWAWRVARAAVPFQVALMLLLCVACLLEPNCCDSVNTFNLSFSPQLRFVHGSPPV